MKRSEITRPAISPASNLLACLTQTLPRADGGSYLKIPMWWVGTLLMILGELVRNLIPGKDPTGPRKGPQWGPFLQSNSADAGPVHGPFGGLTD